MESTKAGRKRRLQDNFCRVAVYSGVSSPLKLRNKRDQTHVESDTTYREIFIVLAGVARPELSESSGSCDAWGQANTNLFSLVSSLRRSLPLLQPSETLTFPGQVPRPARVRKLPWATAKLRDPPLRTATTAIPRSYVGLSRRSLYPVFYARMKSLRNSSEL